jgi:hypothetical protein
LLKISKKATWLRDFNPGTFIIALYSAFKLFTGLAIAAFTALKPTVISAIPNVIAAPKTKIHQCSEVR